MEKLVYRFTLDTRKGGIQKTLQGFGTGDSVSRQLSITLQNGTISYEIDEAHSEAIMYVLDPSSHKVSINKCEFDGNAIHYTVSKEDVRSAGFVEMQLKIINVNPFNGIRKVIAAPKFQLEVETTTNLDDIIEADLEEGTYEGTFSALEKAVGRAQAYYHTRLIQIEFDEENVFHAYYADGTEYIHDGLQNIAEICTEAKEVSQINADLAKSYAVGTNGLVREEDVTDNAQRYSAVASSASISAHEDAQRAEDAARYAVQEATGVIFNVNYATGNVEFESTGYTWSINQVTGELEYEVVS